MNLKTDNIMNTIDTQGKTFEEIQNEMDFIGYAHFDLENYKAKNNLPCFISENSEDISDVESYQSLFKEVLDTIKTKDFFLAVVENYNKGQMILDIEKTINIGDWDAIYLDATGETVEEFAENFLDNYFLGGDEIWCTISTKLADYTN